MADIYYNRFVPSIGTPANCVLSVVGTTGSTSYKYQIAAYNWNGETLSCTALTKTTGNATLSIVNYNHLEWDVVPGAFGYCIYGRITGSTYGLLYKSQSSDFTVISPTVLGWDDQGQDTPDNSIQPATEDTTGRQQWDGLLFRANKSVQSAELNETQAINDFYMNNFGKAFFREGSVIKGCSPLVLSDLVTVVIPEGEVYIVGKIRYIDGGTVTITGTGAEVIGLLVTEVIETEVEDPALNDPAVGAYNYGKDSAHRKSYTFQWVVGNSDAVKVFDVSNGAVIVASSDTDYAQLNKLLATRTFEESGNYVVDSTVILIKEHESDDAKLGVSVDALRAYVQGYRIERTKGAVFDLNKARDTKNVPEEQFIKNASNFIYELANNFVKDFNQCFATIGGNGTFTKGSLDGTDLIHDGLVSLVDVSQGGTTYTVDVDYRMLGYSIKWLNGEDQPVSGTSYVVVYTYRAALTKGTRVKTTVTNEAVTRGAPNTADDLANIDIIDITSVSSVPYWITAHSYTAANQIVYDGVAYVCILNHTSSTTNAPGTTEGETYWSTGTGVIYVEDGDWYKVDGQEDDYIDVGQVNWNLPSSTPEPTGTYYVNYTYWDHDVEGDYICAGSYDTYNDIGIYGEYDLRDSMDIRHPVGWSGTYMENDNINIDYDFYLTRRDLLVVSTKGEIFIIEGTSDPSPARPKAKVDTMALAELRVQAYTYGPGNVQVIMLEIRRSTMEDIKTIEKRVNTIEYYQGLDLLEKEAVDQYTIDSKSGVMVDNFRGSSRTDLWFNRGGITFGLAFDTGRECLQMRSVMNNIDLEGIVGASSTTVQTGKMVTLPYTNVLGGFQPFASQKKNVTPYLVFPWRGNLALDPKEDYWVDTTQAPDLRVETGPTADEMEYWSTVDPWQISATPWEEHITGASSSSKGTGWVDTPVSGSGHHHSNEDSRRTWSGANEITTEVLGYNERKVTQVSFSTDTQIKDMGDRILNTTIAPYIRSRIINITGSKFRPATEIAVKMDDKIMSLVAVAPTVAGATPGCVVTSAAGLFTARFTIPANTFNTGERSISAYNVNGDPDDETSASTVYNAMGIGLTRQKTYLSASYIQPKVNVVSEIEDFKRVTTEVTFLPEPKKVDPLCQSFQYGTTFMLTQVGLFFATKDSVLPITVQIRTMENGYPAAGVLGSVTVYPSAINADETAVTETKITFPEPIIIEQDQWYALAMIADTTTYNMWIATLGATDITTGKMITKQPHNGVLFTSSNNVTWVADPNSDLKFNMYYANFTSTSANLILDSQAINASILSLSSTEVLPGNITDTETALTWYIDDNPPSTYDKVLRSNETTYFNYEAANARFKAVFTTNNSYLSPILNLERLGLMHAKYAIGTKSYISRNTDLTTNPFDNIKVILEMNKPTNTDVRTFFSIDDGYTWTEFTVPISTRAVDTFWTEYQYLDDSLTDAEYFRIRIDMVSTITFNTPRVRKLRVIAY